MLDISLGTLICYLTFDWVTHDVRSVFETSTLRFANANSTVLETAGLPTVDNCDLA